MFQVEDILVIDLSAAKSTMTLNSDIRTPQHFQMKSLNSPQHIEMTNLDSPETPDGQIPLVTLDCDVAIEVYPKETLL